MRKRRSHATPVLVLAVVYVGVGVLTYSLTLGAIDYLLGLNAANKEPGDTIWPSRLFAIWLRVFRLGSIR